MKFIIFFYFFISQSFFSYANDEVALSPLMNLSNKKSAPLDVNDFPQITVKINGEDRSLSCTLDLKSKFYLCPKGQSTILIKYNFMGFNAIGRDEKGQAKTLNVSSVESASKILFAMPAPGLYQEGKFFQTNHNSTFDLNAEHYLKVTLIEQFLMITEFDSSGIQKSRQIEGSDEFNKVAMSYIDEMKDYLDQYNKVRSDNTYYVELSDGIKIKCLRGKTRALNPTEMTYAKNAGIIHQCSSFKCEPITIKGKKFNSLLLFDSNTGSMIAGNLQLYNEEGIGPDVTIKKISSALSSTPLEDNSFSISHPTSQNLNTIFDFKYTLPQDLRQSKDNISLFKDPSFSQFLNYQQDICTKENFIDDFLNSQKNLMNKLAQAELVQYIEMLKDGSLKAQFINPSDASKFGCFYKGVYLNPDAAKNREQIDKNLFPDQNVGQTISLEAANALFKEAQEMKDIAWKYKPDGCYARAHLMARRFEAKGIRVDKAWIKGDLNAPETEPPVRWSFHVAPMVYVKNANEEIQKMIIDPSLFDHPVSVDEWDQKITKNTLRGSVVTAFPFPENAALMERSSLSFSSSNPYLPDEAAGLTESQKIQMAQDVMAKYKELELE